MPYRTERVSGRCRQASHPAPPSKQPPGQGALYVSEDNNPYVLIAIISAYYDGQDWDIDKAMPVIEKYFKLQYIVTETVTTETRYRTEQQSGTRWVTDPDTGQTHLESYTYDEDIPYEYKICNPKRSKDPFYKPANAIVRCRLFLLAGDRWR